MDETPLITRIEFTEPVKSAGDPATRFRVTAQTESDQFVLWLSEDAAKELMVHFAAHLGAPGFE